MIHTDAIIYAPHNNINNVSTFKYKYQYLYRFNHYLKNRILKVYKEGQHLH